MIQADQNKHKSSGNVLFIILIAVALFAALSYAVTSSSRSGGGNTNDEKAKLAASEILQYAAYVKTEVDRMRISRRLDTDELDFQSDIFMNWIASPTSHIDANPNCASSDCYVFQSQGGPVTEIIFEKFIEPDWGQAYATSHPYPGHPNIYRSNIINVGTTNEDLVLQIIRLSDDVCLAINEAVGLPDPSTVTMENFASWGSSEYYSFDDPSVSNSMGDQFTELQGQHVGCYHVNTYDNMFFQVLVER